MDVRSRVEHERTKAFYELLVERLGEEAWAERKAAYVKRIREKDALFNVKFPVEPQLFAPPEERVIRPGTSNDILNLYVKDAASCVGAQWRCDHPDSLRLRSRHFKGLVDDGVSQIPPEKAGIVHIWYETRDGIEIEEMRREKNIENISAYNASGTSVLGVMLHGVNYYPFEDDYQYAETVDNFGRMPGLFDLYPRQTLMIVSDASFEVPGVTHWQQDKAVKPAL